MIVTISAMRAAGLSNDQILAVLEAAEAQEEAKATRRSTGAERTARWRANKAVTKVTESDAVTSQPSQNVTSDKERKVSIPSKERNIYNIYTPDFETFWLAYPERKGTNPKHPAYKKFSEAVRAGAKPEEIISGAKGYSAAESSKIGTEFIMQAKTWLNQRCWEGYQPRAPTLPEAEIIALRERYEQKQREKW